MQRERSTARRASNPLRSSVKIPANNKSQTRRFTRQRRGRSESSLPETQQKWPSVGRLQVAEAVRGRGGTPPPDPFCELNCFNQGPMWTPTKEAGRNHRLLFCCRGSQRGWERLLAPPAGPPLFAVEAVSSQVTVKVSGCCCKRVYKQLSNPDRPERLDP